jgi:hypothetical protein
MGIGKQIARALHTDLVCALALFLSAGAAIASQDRIRIKTGNPCVHQYADLIRDMLDGLSEGREVEAFASTFSDLGRLWRAAGLPDEEIRNNLQFIQYSLANPPDPIWRNLAERLRTAANSGDKLILCVVAKQCDLPLAAGSIHAFTDGSFDIAPFGKNPKETKRIRGLSLQEEVRRRPDLLILNGRFQDVTGFLHEGTHFADFRLVQDWLKANLELVARGEPRDAMFKRFVRQGDDGRLVVDEGFLRIFLESRAYGVQAGIPRLAGAPEREGLAYVNELRAIAMRELEGYAEITRDTMRGFGLSEENIFERGIQLGIDMEATIARAGVAVSPPSALAPIPAKATGDAALPAIAVATPRPVLMSSLGNLVNPIDRQIRPVDDLNYSVLRAVFEPPKWKWREWNFPKLKGEKEHPLHGGRALIEANQSEIEAAGGRIVYSSEIHKKSGSISSGGRNYFRVTHNGNPEIAIEYGTDPSAFHGYMERFRIWRAARDALMAKGLSRKEAGLRAYVEGWDPQRMQQTARNVAFAKANNDGYYDLRGMPEKLQKNGLTAVDIDTIVSAATSGHVNLILNAIRTQREIARRLRKLGVPFDDSHLNFNLMGAAPAPPDAPQIAWSLDSGQLRIGSQSKQVAVREKNDVDALLTLYQSYEEKIQATARGLVDLHYGLRDEAAQRLDELARAAEAAGDPQKAATLRAEIESIRKRRDDLIGQFLFFGESGDQDGLLGPALRHLERHARERRAATPPPLLEN